VAPTKRSSVGQLFLGHCPRNKIIGGYPSEVYAYARHVAIFDRLTIGQSLSRSPISQWSFFYYRLLFSLSPVHCCVLLLLLYCFL